MRLTELMELDSDLPKGAETLLPRSPLPPEEEARILARTLAKAGLDPSGKGEKQTMKRSRFGLMILAAALCIGTVAASAAAYFQMDERLARVLGIGADTPWDPSKNGGSIQTGQTCNGWTMTVDQAVGDRNCAYILLDLTAPEGTVLDADLYQLDCLLAFEGSKGGSYGWEQSEDDDKTDNKISFLVHATMEGDLRKTTGYLRVKGLKAVTFGVEEGGADDTVEQVAELQWKINFPMEYEDDPIVYQPKQTIRAEKGLITGSVTVEQVEITPLSVLVRISGKKELLTRVEARTKGTPRADALLVEVRDKAGSTILPRSSGGRTRGNTIDEVLAFQPVLDPAEIASVVVDGTEIPLTR